VSVGSHYRDSDHIGKCLFAINSIKWLIAGLVINVRFC